MALTLLELDTLSRSEPGDMPTARVYGALRQEILEGTWAPGDVVHEGRLGAVYGVDPAVVRRACLLLADEGLLLRRFGSSIVTAVTLADVAMAYEVRSALEPFAASLAAARIG
ncbi:MAG: GntR family transcriptional regulator, partial [Chloroflexota bacterium]|nr:GntR family transcriptional regulator [Chloroflexota bacterium]